jgi:hypothetical protein
MPEAAGRNRALNGTCRQQARSATNTCAPDIVVQEDRQVVFLLLEDLLHLGQLDVDGES